MKEKQLCPNCNAEIKNGTFSSNPELYKPQTEYINFFLNRGAENYCKKCGTPLLADARSEKIKRFEVAESYIKDNINRIPILTVQNPPGWEYYPVDMVTSQSVMGTGMLSEISSSWADFLGNPSNAYNQKIRNGEVLCKNQLRMECLKIKAHAIIAVDIDYSEAGSTKNMLMVCISGTAIRLANPNVIADGYRDIVQRITEENENLAKYRELQLNLNDTFQ